MNENTEHYDAIVIGSGFGGLYALHHLRDKVGLNVRAFDGAGGVGAPGGTTVIPALESMRRAAPSTPTRSRKKWSTIGSGLKPNPHSPRFSPTSSTSPIVSIC